MAHPFQKFDSTKFKMGGEEQQIAAPGADVLDDPEETPEETPEEKPEGTPPEETPESTETPTGEEPKTGDEKLVAETETTPAEDYTEEDFISDANLLVQERTGGKLKSIDELQAILERNQELEIALQNKEPEFPNPQAKVLYENVIKALGTNLNISDKSSVSAAANYLRLASLDLATLTPKDKQLEAYVLSRSDISRLQAEKIFEKRYEQKFTDLEGDDIQADEHGIATREAEQKILNFQKEFTAAKSEQPEALPVEDPKVIASAIDEVLADFGGLQMKFGENDEAINLPLNEEEVSDFRETLMNPGRVIEKIVDKCVINGKFDWNHFAREMFRIQYGERAVEEAHKAGLTAGQIKVVKDIKNTADPTKTIVKGQAPEGTPKKSFGQTMAEAVAASNKT